MKINSRSSAVIAMLLSILFGSTAGLFIKLSSWDAMPLNGARSLVAAITVWIFLRRPNFTWSRAQIGGAVFYALMLITFIQANRWTTAANAAFLQYTSPLWVALFSIWLLRERPQRSDWLTMFAIAVGMLLFFGGKLSPEGLRGNLIAVVSGMCVALFLIALRQQKDGSPTETVLLGNLIAAAIGLPFIMFGDQPLNIREISIILFLGIFQLGLTFILVTLAIKKLSAMESILIESLAPVLNPVWVFLFINEIPTPSAIAGAAVIVSAVTIRAITAARQTEPGEYDLAQQEHLP
jgi:drug/metabolite transporter (DMT)-like permease